MEQVSVGIKLAINSGLLFGLIIYFGQTALKGELLRNPATISGWSAITLMFGLIVTVQGFETTRYLGGTYDSATRVTSMRLGQVLSTLIYMCYIVLLSYAFAPGTLELDETSIIELMGIVAAILPALLVAAALSAQFSAAVADTSESGGLIAEVTRDKIPPRAAYALLVAAGLALTWSANVFQIISNASRAFAAYYTLQAGFAALGAYGQRDMKRAVLLSIAALLGIVITLFGQSVE